MKTNVKFLILFMTFLLSAGNSLSLASPQSKSNKPKTQKIKKVKTKKKVKKLTREEKKGKLIFLSHCAACHTNGLNLAKPSRPVIGSPTLSTFATFKANLNKPLGNMPHYEHLINDEKMLNNLYKYTKSLENDIDSLNSKEKVKVPKGKKKN